MTGAANDQQDERDTEAALWCLSLAEGELPPGEREAFDRWFADPANASAFEDAARVWNAAGGAADMPELIGMRGAALASYRRASGRRWTVQSGGPWRWALAVAAVLVLAIVSFTLLHDPRRHYETRVGERRVAILDDRSRLTLDADSRVDVGLGEDRRELVLVRGRARFDVAKDPLRPFTVAAGDKLVVATGTSFSVEMVGREVRVLLYEGHVSVIDRDPPAPAKAAAEARPLLAGQEMIATIDAPAAATVVKAVSAQSSSWQNGQLSFDEEPIALAIARMNRHSEVKLVLGDAGAARTRVNGVFTAGDVEAFVEGVTMLGGLHAERTPGRVTLTSG
ncbi:DUF4880 domain-containing protein [Sphingomonas gilva]|uniref:DUF4880 domain-containing protein n=1 Tax=Sphingomonas gilva TaxID=2305907 RepID=A0A396S4Q0_9SPHN|nr:FecR domain-containing protein [Sphingomonas gilva]RHW18405.1 DUF4880 domain-containing protein [Sphingomonas gilva]